MASPRNSLGAITLAHIAVDMQTGALVILLPVLLKTLGLSYATAALILSANNIVIAIAQPLFGILGDRRSMAWLIWLGCLVTGIGMAAVLWLPSYWLIVLAVMFSGLGSAAFHPEGLARARQVSGPRVMSATSVFFTGGNIGFALGPVLASFLLLHWGTTALVWMLIPTALGLVALASQWKMIGAGSISRRAQEGSLAAPLMGLVAFLMVLIVLRSSVVNGMQAFIPLYFDQAGLGAKTEAAFLVALLSISGVVGTLSGGFLAERFGRRVVMMVGIALAAGLLQVFAHSDGLVRALAIALTGVCLSSSWPLIVTMIQEAMPGRVGLASGLSLGTSYGATGLSVAGLGLFADQFGLASTISMLTYLPLVIVLMTWFVPEKVGVLRPQQA
jgi:FSR family fosmidomycin resistance protein-like MFS transporter